jgi:DNA-binding NtrC family response regulator
MESAILIVDDESNVLSSIKRALEDEPYEVLTAKSGLEGLEVIRNRDIKVVISDEMMPGMSGSEFLAAVKKIFPDTIRIMLTGHASVEAAMDAVNNGEIYRFFAKPWDDFQLRLAIRSAIEKYDLEEENRQLLRTVRKQADELKMLEKKYPGISDLERDEEGNVVLKAFDDGEKDLSEIISEIVAEVESKDPSC